MLQRLTDKLAVLIATGIGSGLSRACPGTTGSAACLLVWFISYSLMPKGSYLPEALCLIAVTGAGLWSSSRYILTVARRPGAKEHDPSEVVIDEWAGMLLALIGTATADWHKALIAFALFRFFDIIKPYPIASLERLPAQWGIMADDLAAGAYAWLCLHLGGRLYALFL